MTMQAVSPYISRKLLVSMMLHETLKKRSKYFTQNYLFTNPYSVIADFIQCTIYT